MSNAGNPAENGLAVTGSDTVNFPSATRALYVGSAGGTLIAIMNGVPVTLDNVPIGILPIRCTRVNLSGLTASNIVALW
jgi:hypothetical protein